MGRRSSVRHAFHESMRRLSRASSRRFRVPLEVARLASMSTHRPKVLAIVLAGGEGKRLMPLTADRAKPGVPFAGIYRLIDFALSNVVNSGYLQVVVLTQYKSHSLDRHISQTWRMSSMLGNYVSPVPAQQRVGKHWYMGSGDAIFQSLNLLRDEQPDIVVVVGADHVYRMDFSQMVDQHIDSGAACTVAAIRQPITLADQFGVIDVQPDDPSRIREFLEKPTDPVGLPDSPGRGPGLDGQLRLHRRRTGRGGHPRLRDRRAPSTTWAATSSPGSSAATWRASTTTRTTRSPARPTATGATGATSGRWRRTTRPTWTSSRRCPSSTSTTSRGRSTPPTARSRRPSSSRAPTARWPAPTPRCCRPVSWSPAGSSATRCSRPAVRVESGANVEGSVLLNGVIVGEGAQVRNAIIDKNVVVPPGARVGFDRGGGRGARLPRPGRPHRARQGPALPVTRPAARRRRGPPRRTPPPASPPCRARSGRWGSAPPTAPRRPAAPGCRPVAPCGRANAAR